MNMVIIEMRVKITSPISRWGTILEGLPTSYQNREVPLSAQCVGGGSGVREIDTVNGALRSTRGTDIPSDEILNVSGIYLTMP